MPEYTFRGSDKKLHGMRYIPTDEFDIDWAEENEYFKKVLMPKLNLTETPVTIASTPCTDKGFFYEMWNKQ